MKGFTLISVCFMMMLLMTSDIMGQEICNNGIDDDNNGLIDLDDPACVCFDTATAYVSYISNPSFEEISYCPTNHSQMDGAEMWIQATDATSDYFNCGYTWPAFTQAGIVASDGVGFAGGFFLVRYKEYIGTWLNSPLIAGNAYTLKMDIALIPTEGQTSTPNLCAVNFPPVRVSLFGSPENNTMPQYDNHQCPTGDEADFISNGPSDFVWLGDVLYAPHASWENVSITFTPTQNIHSIMIGPPCDLPPGYPNSYTYPACMPYMVYDNLTLIEFAYFSTPMQPPMVDVNYTVDCAGSDYELSANVIPDANYFWKIPSQEILTGGSISIHDFTESNNGDYTTYYVFGSCTSEVTVTHVLFDSTAVIANSIVLPNIITPNGDGVNDYLDGDEMTNGCDEYELFVWNRWGNMIFKQTKGQPPLLGNNMLGNNVSPGIYFYTIRMNGKDYKSTLTITY